MNEEQDIQSGNSEPLEVNKEPSPNELEQAIINQQPSTEMEVHHHPEVEKKGFKEYLLEGLMIFVAVTMGFFAETIRENISEHERAETFATSMVKELKEDTAQLKSYVKYFTYANNNVDTLMQLLTAADPKDVPSGKLYWYGLWGGAHRYFVPNDATFQQMKSSGSLRYFSKTVAIAVSKYDRFCRMMQSNEEMVRDIYTEIRKSRAQIFDFKYNDAANNIVKANSISFNQARIDSFIHSNPTLLSYDKTLFNQYVELVRSRFMYFNISYADSLLNQGTILINELQHKYDLKNE